MTRGLVTRGRPRFGAAGLSGGELDISGAIVTPMVLCF
jgi:hypothetical protein